MKSYPQIQSLSETQEDFMRFVEVRGRHGNGAYQYGDEYSALDLPGDTVRFSVAASDAERRHTIAFYALGSGGHWEEVAHVTHLLRALESTFEIAGCDIPQGEFAWMTLEPIVRECLERLAGARLLPAAAPSDAPRRCFDVSVA